MTLHQAHETASRRQASVLRAGVVLGVGLGGLLDGILFHLILQWHHVLSARTDDLATNLLADGVFAGVMFLVTLAGLALLWQAWERWAEARPRSRLVGGMLAGWGGFTLAESVVDHHILRLHHVNEAAHAWDVGILVAAGLVLVAGVRIAAAGTRRERETQRGPRAT